MIQIDELRNNHVWRAIAFDGPAQLATAGHHVDDVGDLPCPPSTREDRAHASWGQRIGRVTNDGRRGRGVERVVDAASGEVPQLSDDVPVGRQDDVESRQARAQISDELDAGQWR